MSSVLLTAAMAAIALVAIARALLLEPHLSQTRTPRSAVEHAEQILALRYRRGQLSSEQYERSLAVLRR